jgi:hypothetical protein
MMRFPILLAGFLMTAATASAGGPPVEPSGKSPGESPGESTAAVECRAALDRDLARLQQERETIQALFNADVAANNAADFKLRKAEQAILADLAAEEVDAKARNTRCRSAPQH